MANQTHNYYLPYMRTGMAARVGRGDGEGKRAVVPIILNIESRTIGKKPIEKRVKQEIALYGPGDVLGFSERIIVKTAPAKFVGNFQTNLIPYIEFAEPDFLWRYSSAKAHNQNYWIPWLSLVVLKEKEGDIEGEFLLPKKSDPKLPQRVKISPNAILPDLNQSWRWAHIHINEAANHSFKSIRNKIINSPRKAVCRLMGPRRLEKNTKYCAFVIPTYTLGMEAALGLDIELTNANRSSIVDWNKLIIDKDEEPSNYKTMPYYYKWEFRTGNRGDFEYTIKQLEYRKLEGLGKRVVDCSNPGYGMKSEQLHIEIEGALCSPDIKYQEWGMDIADPADPEKPHDKDKINPSYPFPLQEKLKELLNKQEVIDEFGNQQLRVVPPVYGRWYDAKGNEMDYNLEPKKNEQNWINELNLDFRHRIAAGLGVQFVKENQEILMKSAWQQLREVQKVNQTLNLGRFGRAVSNCMYKRLKKLPPEKLLQLGLPLQTKISTITETSSNMVRASGNIGSNLTRTIFDQIKKSTFSNNVGQIKKKKYLTNKFVPKNNRSFKGDVIQKRNAFQSVESESLVPPDFKPDGLLEKKPVADFTTQITTDKVKVAVNELAQPIEKNIDPKVAIEKRLSNRIDKFRKWEKLKKPAVNLGEPLMVRAGGMGDRETIEPDPLRDIIWYPEFLTPLYRYIKEKSQNLLLPGLESIPKNTVSILTTNPRFIESFMIGVNHEFASELRWREFPTDMRGSYFRKFWDSSIYSVSEAEKQEFAKTRIGIDLLNLVMKGNPDFNTMKKIENIFRKPTLELTEKEMNIMQAYEDAIESWLLTRDEDKDIMHPIDWKLKTRLGAHALGVSRKSGNQDNQIVLMIRGDVLQKFPNLLIYLTGKQNEHTPDLKESVLKKEFPVFEGNIPPDIRFLGFSVTEERKDDYFLIFEERMSEIKYGLDEMDDTTHNNDSGASWENVAWQHFEKTKEGDYLDMDTPVVLDAKAWNNPAFIAKVFTQKSVRVAIALNRFFTDEKK